MGAMTVIDVIRRRFRKVQMKADAIAARLSRFESRDSTDLTSPSRASGEWLCERCGFRYHDHPEHPSAPWMTVLCSGEAVKL